MFFFGKRSSANLSTCDDRLIHIANNALELTPWDFAVIEGHRSLERQKQLFDDGFSHIDGISQIGKHNHEPSLAFDFVPYPPSIAGRRVWDDPMRFHFIIAVMMTVAKSEGIKIRSGADWNMNGTASDQSFHDLGHIELMEE